ncbi:MAG: hypothetical protein M3394_10465, partial [Actinomycetota bacterium]|nr:hypothetical protein [Actinomycetota bacterium]
MTAVRVAAFVVGIGLVLGTAASAVRTMVVPRATPSVIARSVFVGIRYVFRALTRRTSDYDKQDRVMAFYAPLSLVSLPVAWLSIVFGGYTMAFWSLHQRSLREALYLSGSSLLTLGFSRPGDLPALALSVTESGAGIGLLALLISYLPTIYGVFARRETGVALLETRAGSPPSGVNLVVRYHRIGWSGGFEEVWKDWQLWFAELEESHSSMPALVFFRSPQPDRSWVTAAGAVLDGAALLVSTVEGHDDPEAQLLIRSGYVSLRRLATYFDIAFDPDPRPDDPISVTREEFDAACARMAR